MTPTLQMKRINPCSSSDTKLLKYLPALFIYLCLFLLSSCSHTIKKDGPPAFYVDVSKIPNAMPKKEPLSKYGNMPSYRVFGKRYYTLKSSRYYEATGVASWYGTLFHEKRTSSGEPYNMLGMTAAHKTLPLPTYVEVTNLKNNRRIIVKVNDRGPFSSSRLIDLSYVAAKKLDMIGHGTTYVKVKAIDISPFRFHAEKPFYFSSAPSTQVTASSASFSRGHAATTPPLPSNLYSFKKRIYLQVGAFRQKAHALRLKTKLANFIRAPINISHSAKSTLYRVKVGPIHDNIALNKMTAQLKGLGIYPNPV